MNIENETTSLVIESQYLPPVSTFVMMQSFSEIVIDDDERFQKSTNRNRCSIAGANGKILLSIPLIGGRGVKSKTRDVKINNTEPWQQHHWKSIQSAYGKSSFFHFYDDRVRPFYEKRFDFLIDLNTQLLQVCFDVLDWEKKIRFEQSQNLKAKRQELNKKPHTSNLKPYHQVFEERHGFIEDLSIVDLIFNMGNETMSISNFFSSHK